MHKDEHFSLHDITKIEGHASLEVLLKSGIVEKCEFRVSENHRFFEEMCLGKSFSEIPLIVSRICGFCCSSHLNTAVKACENALGLEVSEQTKILREISMNMEHLKSHVLHLYMLVLPDYLQRESVLHFNEKEHKHIHDALDIKKAATDVLRILGARVYHTVNSRIGGFSLLPFQEDIEKASKELFKIRKKVLSAIELFSSFKQPVFERQTRYAALSSQKYELMQGTIKISDGAEIQEKDFLEHFEEKVIPYSTSKDFFYKGSEYMVGALARINLHREKLCAEPKKCIRDLKLKFPNHSPFFNNIAQALEMLQCIDSTIELLDSLKIRQEPLPKTLPKEGKGIGVCEAPRGLLFHSYSIGSDGLIKKADIVVPTSQNNRNTEKDLIDFIPSLLNLKKPEAELEIEKLIRAYDPCISCSTHFLKVKWKKLK